MSRCMCCSSKYECGCVDIQQSVIDLANASQDILMNKLDIELLEKEIEKLKEQLAKAVEVIELTHYDIKNCGFISFMELRLESFLATTKE